MIHPIHKDFEKALRSLSHRHQLWRVFADFCELGAIAYDDPLELNQRRQVRYHEIRRTYEPDEFAVFPQLLGMVACGLEDLDCDFLGSAFMQLELGSHWHGQFFTPIEVSRLMAEMSLTDLEPEGVIARKGFVTVQEPACGAGGMIVALAGAMRARKLNPQTQMHVTAIDVDPTAAHMAMIQLSLCGIPAKVVLGNTLSLEVRDVFTTPFHHLGFWDGKLRRADEAHPAPEVSSPVVAPTPPPEPPPGNRQATAPSPEPAPAPPKGEKRGQLRLF